MNNRKLCNSTSSSELQRRVISVALYRLIPARIVCYRLRAMQFLLYPSPSTSYLDSTTIHNRSVVVANIDPISASRVERRESIDAENKKEREREGEGKKKRKIFMEASSRDSRLRRKGRETRPLLSGPFTQLVDVSLRQSSSH